MNNNGAFWEQQAAADTAPPPAGGDGYDWQDIGKGAVGGVGRGTTGLLGLPGDVSALAARGGEWVGNKLGLPPLPEDVKRANERSRPFTSADIRAPIEKVTGKFYEPHTIAGQYASTLGEFAPAAVFGGGGLTSRIVTTAIPAIASETAGQVTNNNPWARGAAGVLGSVGIGKLVTPAPPATPARQAAVDVLERAGIPVSAGERTGSNAVKWLEETAGGMPFSSGRWQEFRQRQLEKLNQAVTDRTFDPAELQRRGVPPDAAHLPAADVFSHGKKSLQDAYTDLTSRNQFKSNPQLFQDLHNTKTAYESNVLPSQRTSGAKDITDIHDNILDKLVAGGGSMTGTEYQALRSRLGTLSRSAMQQDPYLATALRDTRGALDRAMQQGLSPADAAAWNLNNQRYANMKQLASAVAKSGEYMSPAAIAQAVRGGRAEQFAGGAGNLDELANAAGTVIKPLPNSGTAQRLGWQNLFNAPTAISSAISGAGYLGGALGPLGAIFGASAPHIAARFAVSRPGQRYLGNTVAPRNARDLLAQTLVQQAMSGGEAGPLRITVRPEDADK